MLFFVIFFYFRRNRLSIVKSNGLNVKFKILDYVMFVVLAAGMFLTLLIVNYFYSFFLQEIGYVFPSGPDVNNAWTFIAALFIICVLPAVCEETVFRGAVLTGFSKGFSKKWAIVISALLFMLMHMSISQFVNTFLCGLALAVVVKKTGSTIPGMVMHFTNNFIIVVNTFILSFSKNTSSEKITIDGETVLIFSLLAVLGAGLLIAGFVYIYKRFKSKKKTEEEIVENSLQELQISNGGILGKKKTILYALPGVALAITVTILSIVL